MTTFSSRNNLPHRIQYEDERNQFFESLMVPEEDRVYFPEDDHYYEPDYELIPEHEIEDSVYLPIIFASLVSAISVLGMWFVVRYLRPAPAQPVPVAASVPIYPTSTTISGSQQQKLNQPNANGALVPVDQNTIVDPKPSLVPTVSPAPDLQITPIPMPVYGFETENVEKEFVTDRMRRDAYTVLNTNIPPRDYLAVHLEMTSLTAPVPKTAESWQIGQVRTINVMGTSVNVRLVNIGDQAYFWADDRLTIPADNYAPISNRLDSDLYPRVTSLFGTERTPGIDGDSRFHVFHLARLETRELGFFDSSDVYPKVVFADSNENEAIYINMESLSLGDEVYYGTLVHELQHLIRWSKDRNEETWLDEGLSQVTEIYSGFDSFTVDDYIHHNNIQLNSWSYDSADIYSHYGASALFVVYLWEQFGDQFITNLAQSPFDGMAAVSDALNKVDGNHSLQTVFRDWLIAVYKNDPNVAEPVYGFSRYEFESPAPHQVALASFGNSFADLREGRPQFSGWYVELPSNRDLTLSFAGDSTQTLFPEPVEGADGTVFYASPRNRINSTLSKTVDLRNVISPELNFEVWYDLEDGFDHLYVMVSADKGKSWTPLQTSEMKQGTYGPGLTGNAGNWITQSASLMQWSGREIMIRFQLLTDSAVPGNGAAVDNVHIAGLGNSSFNLDHDGWFAQGFARTGHLIPQEWTVSVVHEYNDGQIVIEDFIVDEFAELKVPLSIQREGTLVIAPSSPLSNSPADFWFEVE